MRKLVALATILSPLPGVALADSVDLYANNFFNSVSTVLSPVDAFSWMVESSKMLVRMHVYDLITVVSIALLAYSVVVIAQNYLLLGTPFLRRALPRLFAAMLVIIFTAYPSNSSASQSIHNKILSLWGAALSSSTNASYVHQASMEFLTAASNVWKTTLIYGGTAFVYGATANALTGGLRTSAGGAEEGGASTATTRKLINSSAINTGLAYVREPVKIVYKLLSANIMMFLALGLIYSLTTILAGFTYLMAIMLMPLAAALYMFRPTERFLKSLLTATIASLLLILLAPHLLAITLKASINRTQAYTAEQMNRTIAYTKLAELIAHEQKFQINEAVTLCLERGYHLTGSAVTRPVTYTYTPPDSNQPITVTGQYYALAGDFNEWCDTASPPEHLTAEDIDREISDNLLHGAPNVAAGLSRPQAFFTTILAILSTLAASTIAFFLFLGAVNITSKLMNGINFGGALENPLT